MGLRPESRAHVVLESWMISELGLHGNKLIAYAIIYGCSLAGNQEFTASINYFCSWLDMERAQVLSVLRDLEKSKLIKRSSKVKDGITYNSYRAIIPMPEEEKKELPDDFMTPPVDDKEENIPYQQIVAHLNNLAGTSYRHTTANTRKHIRARWKEKYSLEDFFTVIEGRVKAWKNDKKMSGYLRPDTIFGTKFESYLQDAKRKGVHSEESEDQPVLDDEGKPKEY